MIRVNHCRYWCVPWRLQKGVSRPTSTISLIQRQSSWLYSHMSQYISLRRRRLWFKSIVRYQGRLECLNLQLGRERLYVSFWLCDATRIPKETIGIELKPVRTIENWKRVKISRLSRTFLWNMRAMQQIIFINIFYLLNNLQTTGSHSSK